MFYDRRKAERVKVNLDASWEGAFARHDGSVADISLTGCFMLTPDCVKPNELVRIEIELPTGERLCLWGEIIYQISEMGFGVRFTHVQEGEQKMLAGMINSLLAKKPVAVPVPAQSVPASARR